MPTIAELEARNEILSRRLEEAEQQLAKAERKAEKAETRAIQAEGEAEKRAIESYLRLAAFAAGSDEGPIEAAVADAMRSANWKLDSKGKLLRVREDGQYDMTPSGDYVSATAWMREHARTMPSYFPKAQASGTATSASSSSQDSVAGVNYWSPDHWDTTKQGYVIRDHGMAAAKAMADAAGVDVYATKPRAR